MPDDAPSSPWSAVTAPPEIPEPLETFEPTPDSTGALPLPPRAALTDPPAVYDPSMSLSDPDLTDSEASGSHRASSLGQYFPPRGGDDAARAAAAQVPLPH